MVHLVGVVPDAILYIFVCRSTRNINLWPTGHMACEFTFLPLTWKMMPCDQKTTIGFCRILAISCFSLLLWMLPLALAAQLPFQVYHFPDTIPDAHIVDVEAEIQKMTEAPFEDATPSEKQRFAVQMSYYKRSLLASGSVYMGWPEMENYLNQMLQSLLPDSLPQKNDVKVYLMRSSYVNAYAIHDGSLFVNIGLIAEMSSEAALATIMAHEIAHFSGNDVKREYVEGRTTRTRENRGNLSFLTSHSRFNKKQESVADSIGFELAYAAGYNVVSARNNFTLFKEIENLGDERRAANTPLTINRRNPRDYAKLLADHPDLDDRMNKLDEFVEGIEAYKGSDYLIGKDIFSQLKEKARTETLVLMLEDNELMSCAEKAFTYLLAAPESEVYLYYLLESVRRLMVEQPDLRNKGFLTHQFSRKFERGQGILHDLSHLVPSDDGQKNIQLTALADSAAIEFETYPEAFLYFADMALKAGHTEPLLTIALNDRSSPEAEKLLKKYIAAEGAHFKPFAQALLEASDQSPLKVKGKHQVLVGGFTLIEDHSFGYYNRLLLANKKYPQYLRKLNRLVENKFEEREVVQLAGLSENTFSSQYLTYHRLLNMIQELAINEEREAKPHSFIARSATSRNSQQKHLLLYAPEYYDWLVENEIAALDYLAVVSFSVKDGSDYLQRNLSGVGILLSIFNGSLSHAYRLDYANYNFQQFEGLQYDYTVRYKMRFPYLMNSIFHALQTSKND